MSHKAEQPIGGWGEGELEGEWADWEEFEEDIFGSRVCGEMPVHVICEGRVGHSHIGAGYA